MQLRVSSTLLVAILIAAPLGVAGAQANGSKPAAATGAPTSTMGGVFTMEQATKGRTVYAEQCSSCHSTSTHSGTDFMKSWSGRTLWDLFAFLKETMPQSDPGFLSDDEYLHVVTYLLSLNKMPAGQRALVVNEAAMKAIRIDTTQAPSGTPAPRR